MTTNSTALVEIRPDQDEKVQALYEEGVALKAYAEALVITSDEDTKGATDNLSIIAGLKKSIEKARTEYVGPLNNHVKDINAMFKDFVAPLEEADKVARGKVLAYRAEQERIRQEQERINQLRIEAAQAEMELKGELTEEVNLVEVAPDVPKAYRTGMSTMATPKVWKFEVTDQALLPEEYKIPDMVKIRKVVTARATIPGVRAWQEETLSVGARR